MTDYYDIHNWKESPAKFYDYFKNRSKSKYKVEFVTPLIIDTVKLYALLKLKVSSSPNGFYTYVQEGLPLDNMIWWDYILESEKGFIHIWRTSHVIEAMYWFENGQLDLAKFFHQNIKQSIDDIRKVIKSFDQHILYINHYKSYRDCTEYLWKEIEKINLTPPNSPEIHAVEKAILDKYFQELKEFMENSIKFHTLGKSLLLNAAFEIESFLNLVIRVGATPNLKDYPDVLKKHLNNSFPDKLKNLKFYSIILLNDIDLENQSIKDAFELMTLRNKYVHFDESSAHNRIGEIYFDNDFPLQPTTKEAPAVSALKQIFHRPDFKTVKKAFETANNFVAYLESLFIPEYAKSLVFLLKQNPIGYNENRKVYSGVSNELMAEFYFPLSPKGDDPSSS